MTLAKALQASLSDIPDGVAVGYIDLSTGTLVSYYSEKDLPQEFMNAIAAAVCELIEAPIVRVLNGVWSESDDAGSVTDEPFDEMLMFGQEHTVLIKKIADIENAAAVYVARKDTPAGVMLMSVRCSIDGIKKHIERE